jgi:hypothetical protein
MTYRLYTFVANLYLSPLQCGLQTAHVVSELSQLQDTEQMHAYDMWASVDKTIIICAAINHAGVKDAFAKLDNMGTVHVKGLPYAIFHEDEQSMNGMATACGIIVPEEFFDVIYESAADNGVVNRYVHSKTDENGRVHTMFAYPQGSDAFEFISFLKGFRLA